MRPHPSALILLAVLSCLAGARPLGSKDRPPFIGHLASPVSLDGHDATITQRTSDPGTSAPWRPVARTSRDFHRAGLASLAVFAMDDAVDLLTRASTLDPSAPRLANDLGVALFERGLSRSSAQDLFLALGHVLRAVRLDPALETARLNCALILDQLSGSATRHSAWNAIAQAADNAIRHIAQFHLQLASTLDRPPRTPDLAQTLKRATYAGDWPETEAIARRWPDAARRWVEHEGWIHWASAFEADDHGAGQYWEALATIGRVLEAVYEDPSVLSRLQQLEHALVPGTRSSARLARAVRAYGESVALFHAGRFEEAAQQFRHTRSLDALGGAWQGWLDFRSAQHLSATLAYTAALERLGSAARLAERIQDPILLATSLARINNLRLTLGEPDGALSASRRSHALFRQHHAPMQAARTAALHALALEHQGHQGEAWMWLQLGFRDLGDRDDFNARSLLMAASSHLAIASGEADLALFFHNQYVDLALDSMRSEVIADALRGRARLHHDLERPQEAYADLAQARAWWNRMDDEAMRQAVEEELLMVEALVYRAIDLPRARQSIARAVDLVRATNYPYKLAKALQLESTIQIALGRPLAAEQSLVSALAEIERQRRTISHPTDRVSYLDQRRALLDAMVALQLDHLERSERALVYSDRARANVLRDWMSDNAQATSTGAIDSSHVDAANPSPTEVRHTIITYAVHEERTIAWVQSPEGRVAHRAWPVGRKALEAVAERWRSSLRDGRTSEADLLAQQLHGWLLAPLASHLDSSHGHWVVVPDGALHRIPFGLLRDPATNRRVVEDHVLTVAPTHLHARQLKERAPRSRPWTDTPLLMVSAPTREDDRGNPLQIHASDRAVASLFPSHTLLQADHATKRSFLEQAPNYELLYFGGHAVVDRAAPMRSHMLFATAAGDLDDGRLYPNEILEMDLHDTRLVILASCDTANGHLARSEGVESLARPFLAAGAARVIASLWPVEDAATARLFQQFFRHLSTDVGPAEALRQTQRTLARDAPNEIETWGAFVLYSR